MNRVTNGVNVAALDETVEAIRETPVIARFRFRATNRWIAGGRNESRIHGFFGACEERSHRQEFVVVSDLPPVSLGTDRAPSPPEYVLAALAACLTTTLVYHAAALDVRLTRLEAEVEGSLDLHGFLGLTDRVRPGYRDILVRLRIDSDAPPDRLDTLVRIARHNSPVVDMLANSVPIRVEAERYGSSDRGRNRGASRAAASTGKETDHE